MKLLRLLLVVAIVGSVTFSCKKSDKEKIKDDVKETAKDVKDAANNSADKVKEVASDAAESVKDAANNSADKVKEVTSDAAESVKDAANDVADDVKDVTDKAVKDVKEAAKEVKEGVKKAANELVSVVYPKDLKFQREVDKGLRDFHKAYPSLKKATSKAYGFVYFPKITKGAFVVGGAGGKGLVFERGVVIGSAKLMQATIGAQVGGQDYEEIIFFKNKAALDKFKNNKFKFSAQASAVALKSGASIDLDYQDGVAVYTYDEKGLMAEASVGAQKFNYKHGIK